MAALSGLASALESYRGRDRLIRTLGYCCQLVGGVLVGQGPARADVGARLLALSSQLSGCRTTLRLFDDAAMLLYTRQYGLGAEEEDVLVRCVSVLGNLADQLYYPCEHIAWAADAGVLHVDSARWWALSTALWGLSLLLGVARCSRYTFVLSGKRTNPRWRIPLTHRQGDPEIPACTPLPLCPLTLHSADTSSLLRSPRYRVPVGGPEAETAAEEPGSGRQQPAAPEHAGGRRGPDPVGARDCPEQPGRPGQRRALAAPGLPVGRPLPPVAGGPPGHHLLPPRRVPGSPGQRPGWQGRLLTAGGARTPRSL